MLADLHGFFSYLHKFGMSVYKQTGMQRLATESAVQNVDSIACEK